MKLADLCKTQWVARIAACETFSELLPYIMDSFEAEDGSSQKATSLLTAITKFEFLLAFSVLNVLGFNKRIDCITVESCTRYLQFI